MKKPVEVFFDNCIFSHSVTDVKSLTPERDRWLIDQIPAIEELHDLYLGDEIKIEYDLNIFIELWMCNSIIKQLIEEKWGEIKPGPTWVGFRGTMVNCIVKAGWEKRLLKLKEIFKDDSLDVTHLANAELYNVEYFVTTDHKLINKANNEGKGRLRIKVVSPREFLEIYHAEN